MDKNQKTIIDEMREFRTLLMGFTVLRQKIIEEGKKLTSEEKKTLTSLFDEISIDAGKYGPLIKEITGLETIHTSAGPQDIWNWALSIETNILVTNALDNCISATARTMGTLQRDIDNGLRDEKTGHLILRRADKNIEPITAFIAHEGETRALTILKDFLEALGIQYFIAESRASNGRSIEGQVNWTQSKADFAICLATKGKAVNKKTDKHYMAPNISDELGRARQVFGNKIILLVQKGVEVHTNIREIVYETFTTTNMEKAFIKIVRELTNWGFIKAGTIKE
jgi:predicted nucleotide-binding protein